MTAEPLPHHFESGARVVTVFPMDDTYGRYGTVVHRSELTGRWWVKMDRASLPLLFRSCEISLASDERGQ